MKKFIFYFFIQFISYALFCWNTRAIADAWYGSIIITDALIAALNFTLIKKVANEQHGWALAGYVLGGPVGSLFSVYLTRRYIG